MTPAKVTGVYATFHTDKGNVDTGPPRAIVIDCELLQFQFSIDVPFTSKVTGETLHLGVHAVALEPNVERFVKGDHLIVLNTIHIGGLSPVFGTRSVPL